jgi:hypothetical protein
MERKPTTSVPDGLARDHCVVSLSVLGTVIILCASLLYLVHDPRYDQLSRDYRWNEARRTKNVFLPITHIKNDGDRVINVDLLSADHSRGSIDFFGTSNLEWGLKLWDLPASESIYFHNFALNATGHAAQLKLIRFLVEDEALLRAGPERSLIVLGTCYQTVGFAEEGSVHLSRTLEHHGFFTRAPDGTIHRARTSWLERFLVIEKLKLEGVARELAHIARLEIDDLLGRSRPRFYDPEAYMFYRRKLLGPSWKDRIRNEVNDFAILADYLKAHKIPTAVVLMPQASWEAKLPFDKEYNEKLLVVCRSRELKVYDLRKLLDDDDFADSNHFTPTGVEKFQNAILPFCRVHLRSTEILAE